jgi:hypothetical protein
MKTSRLLKTTLQMRPTANTPSVNASNNAESPPGRRASAKDHGCVLGLGPSLFLVGGAGRTRLVGTK